MKCAADKIIAEQREKARVDRVAEQYNMLREDMFRYLDYATAYILHDKLGFGKDRLFNLFNGTTVDLNDTFDFVKTDGDSDREMVEITRVAYIGRFGRFGFYPKQIEEDATKDIGSEFFKKYHTKKERAFYRGRMDYITQSMLPVFTYFYSVLWYLHEEHGFGKDRLTDIYKALLSQYVKWCDVLMMCNPYADAILSKLYEAFRDELAKIHFYFGKPEDNNTENLNTQKEI